MPLDIPKVRFFGRPLKPVALGFMLAMFVISFVGWSNIGVLDGWAWADVLSWFSASVGIWLFVAWWRKSQRLAEIGLLLVFAVLIFRAALAFCLLSGEPDQGFIPETTLLSLCWAVIAGGAWWLEQADPDAPQKWSG